MAPVPYDVILPAGAVKVPGAGWQYVLDSDYPRADRERWARLDTGTTRRFGRKGFQWLSPLASAADLNDLYQYMESAAGAQGAALADQQGDPETYAEVRKDWVGLHTGAERIAAALRFYGVEPETFTEQCRREAAERKADA